MNLMKGTAVHKSTSWNNLRVQSSTNSMIAILSFLQSCDQKFLPGPQGQPANLRQVKGGGWADWHLRAHWAHALLSRALVSPPLPRRPVGTRFAGQSATSTKMVFPDLSSLTAKMIFPDLRPLTVFPDLSPPSWVHVDLRLLWCMFVPLWRLELVRLELYVCNLEVMVLVLNEGSCLRGKVEGILYRAQHFRCLSSVT